MKIKLRKSSFFWVLLKMNMLPLILLTLVITTFSAAQFASSMNEENTVYLMKGEHLLNGDFTIIDSIKGKTGVDITIFYQDTRVVTTIQMEDGMRAIGTKASAAVVQDVLRGGHSQFYSSMMVEGVRYFSYYEPIFDSDGTCIGMIFLGEPSAEVEKLVCVSLSPIIIIGILTMFIACLVTVRFSNKLVMAIRKTESFLETIAKGELHAELYEGKNSGRNKIVYEK